LCSIVVDHVLRHASPVPVYRFDSVPVDRHVERNESFLHGKLLYGVVRAVRGEVDRTEHQDQFLALGVVLDRKAFGSGRPGGVVLRWGAGGRRGHRRQPHDGQRAAAPGGPVDTHIEPRR
jgi:hypothetical protein